MQLAKEFENDIKSIKDACYRMSWYMRGGVSVDTLLYDTDVEDNEIMQNLIKDNIENTKNSKMPLL
tara:strand:+ start:1770 stop:1967 length:198 start_codon:yes stop_codon:yes gene_type:complete